MIPKKIHYVWLGGGDKSKLTQVCVNSWRRTMPEYEIIEWNENNIDINKIRKENKFVDKCYKLKLWAYVSDYLRLKILYDNGGLYFDTDVETVKSFDDLLDNKMFVGLERTKNIGAGVIGAEKGHPLIKRLLEFYDNEIWDVDFVNSPVIYQHIWETEPERFENCKIYPAEYFYEYHPAIKYTKMIEKENTYSNHWYTQYWNMSRKGYVFLTSKHIKMPLKVFAIIKKNIGYIKRKINKPTNY